MRLVVVPVLAASLFLPPVIATADTPTASTAATAKSYCRTLHRAHPATYHERYGRDRHAFGRCTRDWRRDHAGHHHD